MRSLALTLAMVTGFAAPVLANGIYRLPDDPDESGFIQDEIIATFYHELGHALIDVLQLPVLGKEEDAADHLSVILMNDIWEEGAAAEILTHDAQAYRLAAETAEKTGEEPVYWDVHSLDMQRYYTVVCLFYGANPEKRAKLAKDLELPQERADGCPDEYAEASDSWYVELDGTDPAGTAPWLKMAAGQQGDLVDLLAEEVKTINESFGLPEEVTVKVADCGEANAFYDPEDRSITMCNEYAKNLQELWETQ